VIRHLHHLHLLIPTEIIKSMTVTLEVTGILSQVAALQMAVTVVRDNRERRRARLVVARNNPTLHRAPRILRSPKPLPTTKVQTTRKTQTRALMHPIHKANHHKLEHRLPLVSLPMILSPAVPELVLVSV